MSPAFRQAQDKGRSSTIHSSTESTDMDSTQNGEIETAGLIEVEIPAVVTPQGEVNASYRIEKGGKDITDTGLLYDAFPLDQPAKLVLIKAQINLDQVFEGYVVEGEVEANPES